MLGYSLSNWMFTGNVIGTERVWTKFRQHCTWIDADRCHFHDRHEIPTCRLYGFRVFYETGLITPTIIGLSIVCLHVLIECLHVLIECLHVLIECLHVLIECL